MKSSKKNKKIKTVFSFRISPEILSAIKEIQKKDPITFRTTSSIAEAALLHFTKLSKSKQKEALKDYLGKQL